MSRPISWSSSSRGAPAVVSAVFTCVRVRARRSAPDGDNHMVVPDETNLVETLRFACPFLRPKGDPREANDFSPAPHGDIGREQALELVPGLTVHSRVQLGECPDASILRLVDRQVELCRGVGQDALAEKATRLFSKCRSTFRSYSSAARSAAARAPAESPPAPNTVARARHASPWSTRASVRPARAAASSATRRAPS